ncbi:MAG TPA: germination protein YpeB [Clostridia bacterium]|nr:germination protein YpeB [Clostridia bacterium]
MDRQRAVTFVLLLALVAVGVWGYDQYRQKNDYHVFLQNQYHRMFYELIDHVETIEADLAKAMVVDSPQQNLVLYSDVWRQAFSAQEKLNQLPISHLTLSNTSKFLTQVGDYGYSLTRKNADGTPVSADDWSNLEELHNYAGYLAVELQKLRASVQEKNISLGDLTREGGYIFARASDNLPNREFTRIEQEMVDYPTLIYDGPFSEHIQDIKPKGLVGDNIDYQRAEQVARGFLKGVDIQNIKKIGNGNGDIKTYGLEVLTEGGNRIYMDISRKGGHVVWMLNQRDVDSVNISPTRAVELAKKFLEQNGYKNMVPTYSMRYDNISVINFAYSEKDVVIYTDLIKVKVALDNGEIVGFEAEGYLKAHHSRKLPEPKLTADQAGERISMRLETGREPRLALIPLENKDEVLCYEFRGTFGGDDFLVYINALTGKEERILKLLRSENGTLTI